MILSVGRTSGLPDFRRILEICIVCCGEMSSWTRWGQPLMGNLLNRHCHRDMYISACRKFPMTSVCDILLYLSISFSVYVAQTQSLFGACCLRMPQHLHHYLDRVHSDLNNIWFKQCQHTICCWAVSRHNMWSSVKALLSHMCWLVMFVFSLNLFRLNTWSIWGVIISWNQRISMTNCQLCHTSSRGAC